MAPCTAPEGSPGTTHTTSTPRLHATLPLPPVTSSLAPSPPPALHRRSGSLSLPREQPATSRGRAGGQLFGGAGEWGAAGLRGWGGGRGGPEGAEELRVEEVLVLDVHARLRRPHRCQVPHTHQHLPVSKPPLPPFPRPPLSSAPTTPFFVRKQTWWQRDDLCRGNGPSASTATPSGFLDANLKELRVVLVARGKVDITEAEVQQMIA